MCQQVSRPLISTGEVSVGDPFESCILCRCIVRDDPNFFVTSPFTVLWREAFLVRLLTTH